MHLSNTLEKMVINEGEHHLFIDFKKHYDSISRGVLYNILIALDIPTKLVRLTECV